jgi:hypothetical protein
MTIKTNKNTHKAMLFTLALSFAGICRAGQLEELRASANIFVNSRYFPPVYARIPAPLPSRTTKIIPQEVTDKLPELGIKLEQNDLWRIEEIYNFWNQAGKEVWPGVTGLAATPIQFLFAEKYNILIGHPTPPADCLPFSERLPASKFCYQKDNLFIHGAISGPVNGVPTVSFNTMAAQEEYVAQLFPGSDYKADYMHNSATISHELFHAFQYREKEFLPAEAGYPPLSKIDYPYIDAELNMLLGLEGKILADALDETNVENLKRLMRDFMAVRGERHSLLPRFIPILGRYLELVEGTAQYVTFKVEYGAYPGLQPMPETLADPRFKGYRTTDAGTVVLKTTLSTLHTYNYSKFASYTYFTGAALGRVLDKLDPAWKTDLFRKCSGKGSGLDTILEQLVTPDNSAARLAQVKARYNAPELLAAAAKDLGALLEDNKKKIDAYRATQGRRFILLFPGTTASGLTIYAPGSMVEYGSERLYDRGCSKIEYEKAGAGAEIKFSRAIPVLLDKSGPAVELIIPAGLQAAPEITADSVSRDGGSVVYQGNVSYQNGVFGWKGARLGVADRGGDTVLTFFPSSLN